MITVDTISEAVSSLLHTQSVLDTLLVDEVDVSKISDDGVGLVPISVLGVGKIVTVAVGSIALVQTGKGKVELTASLVVIGSVAELSSVIY